MGVTVWGRCTGPGKEGHEESWGLVCLGRMAF